MLFLIFLYLAACQPSPERGQAVTDTPVQTTVSPTATAAPSRTPTATATHTRPAPTATAAPEIVVCSPLQGILLEDLPGMITNPFHPPPPGSDDPHQAVDFSDLSPGTSIALEGRPVQAVLSGRVAGLARERFPYGNALLVETPLEELPQALLSRLPVPTPAPTLEPRSALTCPQPFTNYGDTGNRSLYLLYAHMQAPAELQLEAPLRCGEVIGKIGGSGNALNPHLHLEARVGPAGARLESLAHYDPSASAEEMSAYCAWRVSGLFQLLDPMALFSLPPQ